MTQTASPRIAEHARLIVERLQRAGHQAFWVGGCVRDRLLGRAALDYDVSTSALPEQVEKIFERTIPVGRKFGVVIVVLEGAQFQVATFRAEADYEDGRHPGKVTFADARADAERRDFTVNGLFFDPISGALHDWVGGEADLKRKIIRTIGKPEERFGEDHLRMLRAVRFSVQLGFDLAPETFAAIQNQADKIAAISSERIRDELLKIFAAPHAAQGLKLLESSGLLRIILPELQATVACEQSPEHHPEGSVFNHLLLMLSHLAIDSAPNLPWAVLLHDIAKPVTFSRDPENGRIHFYGHEKVGAEMAEVILGRLKFPRKDLEDIVQAVLCHMQFKDVKEMRKSTLRRLIMRPTFPLELELHRLDCLGSRGDLDLHQFLLEQERLLKEQPEIIPPLLTGEDLMALGISPGPLMGTLLRELREKQLQDELVSADQAREWVRAHIQSSKS
jgi:poly(A) polymerase